MKRNGISLDGITVGADGFKSFNSFFTRKRDKVVFKGEESDLLSPCDAFLSAYTADKDSTFRVKGCDYSLYGLLRDRELAEKFTGGTVLVFRLTPAHYHRYHYAVGGKIVCRKKIGGVLHTVRPIATENLPVFIENSREYVTVLSEKFGSVVQMEVGALLVGKIVNHENGDIAVRGDEKGYFEYGGSTVILIFEKDRVTLTEKFARAYECETPICIGEKAGKTNG